MIDPFDNDHQSQQIGQLIIENQTDKVIIYGDIEITKTEVGLNQAKQLQQLFNSIVDTLDKAKHNDAEPLPENEPSKEATNPKIVKNPFS